MTVLFLMLSVVMAWIEDRLSVQMMICLLLFDVRCVQASVIASVIACTTILRARNAPSHTCDQVRARWREAPPREHCK